MRIVEKFLCFRLETGGKVIGWFGIIIHILLIIFDIIFIFLLMIDGEEYIDEIMRSMADDTVNCNLRPGRGIIIFWCLFLAILWISYAGISYLCVKAVGTRNQWLLLPMLMWLGMYALYSVRGVFTLEASGIGYGLLFGVIWGYCFIVICSLFETFRRKDLYGTDVDYHRSGAMV